jgi:hypothetical protein
MLGISLAMPGTALAVERAPEPDPTHDARTEGYERPVQIDGSTGLIWILFFFLSVCSMSVLFKDSRRATTE